MYARKSISQSAHANLALFLHKEGCNIAFAKNKQSHVYSPES